MNKICSKCGIEKPLDQFYKHNTAKDGRTPACIECTKIAHRQYKLKTRPSGPREARARREELLAHGLKECKGCKQIKAVSEFYEVKKGRPSPYCKKCEMAKNKLWKAEHPEHMLAYSRAYAAVPENKERQMKTRRKRVEATPHYTMKVTLSHGLKRKPTENPATVEDLMQKWHDQDGCCALTGIRMTWAKGEVLPTSLSLDRIDWRKGYSADNIRLICHAINAFRGRMSDDLMCDMALALIAKKRPEMLNQSKIWNTPTIEEITPAWKPHVAPTWDFPIPAFGS